MEIGTGKNENYLRVLWDKVKKYEPEHKGHWVRPGQPGVLFLIDANGKRIRDIMEPGPTNTEAEATPAVNNKPTAPQARADGAPQTAEETAAAALCSGEPLVNLKTKGRAPSAALFREVIKAQRDVAPSKSSLKIITTIGSLKVGNGYRWREGIDLQLLGLPKTVYPVGVSFTTCEDSAYYWNIHESKNYSYSCYKDDASGEWTCSLTTGRGDSRESRQVKKQAFYDFTGQPRKK